jgi:pyruvate,water dikinase
VHDQKLAEASFAGQQESYLNVKGDSSLITHVKMCFASLYTARAIYYRNKKGFNEGQSLLAAVVQKMVNSEKSGVVFSRNPVTFNDDVVLESVFGLGEGIVSGMIKPDHFVISRDLEIKEVKIVDKKIAIIRTGSGQNETVRLSSEKSREQTLTNREFGSCELCNQIRRSL